MHETIIANKIIKEAEKHGKVKEIFLEVGELAHLPPEELEETLKIMVKWSINMKIIESRISCKCGYKGKPNILERGHDICIYECPKCRQTPKLEKGNEIRLTKVILE